jgi:hypothetical protein
MQSSSILNPPKEPMLVIRPWHLAACDGDACAAMVLAFLIAATGIAAPNREDYPDYQIDNDPGFRNTRQIEAGIFQLYKQDRIRRALKLLTAKGFVKVAKNQYKYDRTNYFQVDVKAVNASGQFVSSKWIREQQ